MSRPAERARIVQIAPSIPFPGIPHAGGRHQLDVVDSQLRQGAVTVLIVPSFPVTRRDMTAALPGLTVLEPERGVSHSRVTGLLLRASHRLLNVVKRSPVPWVHPPFVLALLLTPRVRRLLSTADVVDLQWFESILLAPVIRALVGRNTRIVGTFHDVMSQRLRRRADVAGSDVEADAHRRLAARVESMEKHLTAWLDEFVVLSEKDAVLLRNAGVPSERIRVVPPRIEAPAARPGPSHGRTAVLVGYLVRQENIDAATWFLTEVWPLVVTEVPDARLDIVGAGAPSELLELAESTANVRMRGFVDDLWSVYRDAACSVVPLRDGAGVKFKTLESMLAGVPTVATPIGAEGVGNPDDYVVISEDPAELADATVRALNGRVDLDRTLATAARLREAHSGASFDAAIRETYLNPPRAGRRRLIDSSRAG
jgi:glycosyltransferase involved in cell wall biosynthesis